MCGQTKESELIKALAHSDKVISALNKVILSQNELIKKLEERIKNGKAK